MSVSENVPSPQVATTAVPPPRRRRWRRYVLLGVFLLLVAGEIGARLLAESDTQFNLRFGGFKEWDPFRKARLRPNYHVGDMHINSKGMFGPEFEAKKPTGGYRIAVLGDSASVMPTRRPYPRVLEDLLRQAHPERHIEVINAACPGYHSGQARTWYEREVDEYEHDALVIYLGWNDMGQFNPDGLAYKLHETGYLQKPTLLQSALLHCYLLRSLYVVQGYWEHGQTFSFAPLDAEEQEAYSQFYPTHFEEHLVAVIKLAKSRDRQVFLMNFAGLVHESPTLDEQRRMHFPRGMGKRLAKYLALKGAYEKALDKVVAETGVQVIDIASVFSTPESRLVFTDSAHFTVEGAEKIAGTIAKAIEPYIP